MLSYFDFYFHQVFNLNSNILTSGAVEFARTEGLIAAQESTHTIAAVVKEALRCKETGESKVILFALSGNGNFDLSAYDKFLQGNLSDLAFAEEKMQDSLTKIPALA